MWWQGSRSNARRVGICVSRSVRDHVHGRLDLKFEELGSLNLKNIARPVEAFALSFNGDAGRPNSVDWLSHSG